MFMRYLGGGVGHQRDGQPQSTVEIITEPDGWNGDSDSSDDDDDTSSAGSGKASALEDEEVDYGYVDSDYGDENPDHDPATGDLPPPRPVSEADWSDVESSDSGDDVHDDDDELLEAGGFNAY